MKVNSEFFKKIEKGIKVDLDDHDRFEIARNIDKIPKDLRSKVLTVVFG